MGEKEDLESEGGADGEQCEQDRRGRDLDVETGTAGGCGASGG